MRRLIAERPNDFETRVHLSELLIAEKMDDEALGVLEAALALRPHDLGALRMYARLLYERGSYEEARRRLERAAAAGSADPESDMLLSRVCLQLGDRDEAEVLYRKAVLAHPDLEDASYLAAVRSGGKGASSSLAKAPGPARGAGHGGEGSRVSFDDVGGMEDVKEYLRMNMVAPLRKPELFRRYGKRIGGGILMFGPPGCGKTYIARALAGECNAEFYAVGLHEILDMYIGNSERNLHALFAQARRSAPSIVFLDEIDVLGQRRGNPSVAALRGVTNTLMSEMDDVGTPDKPVLVVGATNTPWSVDVALRRPGRFDRVVFVPPPDQKAREEILRLHLRGKPTTEIDAARVASKMERFSGADVRAVVDRAVEGAISRATRSGAVEPVTTEMLLEAVKRVRPSTEEWLATAADYVRYSNEGGMYDQVKEYLAKRS